MTEPAALDVMPRKKRPAGNHLAPLQSTPEQTLERLCSSAIELMQVSASALLLKQGGQSRIIASRGLSKPYRSYHWAADETAYKPGEYAVFPDAAQIPSIQKTAHDLGLSHAGFFLRIPVVVKDDYIVSLILLDEKSRKKPTKKQQDLLHDIVALIRYIFESDELSLTNPDADVTIPMTLDMICDVFKKSDHAEVLLDANLSVIAASTAFADLLHTDVDSLIGTSYAEHTFSGIEPILFFCRSALATRISPPDFEITIEDTRHLRRVFQISVSPLSPTDTRDYFLHLLVQEITVRSALEERLIRETAHVKKSAAPLEPSFAFLLETLIERRSLRARKNFTYLTLRSWRQPIRTYQIQALKALKKNLPPAMPTMIADEMANELTSLVGAGAFKAIVPVPCGHTREGPCLSLEIARALGVKLGLPVIQAFAAQSLSGVSHPKENKKRPPLNLVRKVHEPVLLVDDVATSGAHLEEASTLLKPTCGSLLAFAWIGGDAK